uniref:Uncharacterized protein n=1 Tax=Manihot esculenta TaxID=3983 RepID=A0A199U9G8_MANES
MLFLQSKEGLGLSHSTWKQEFFLNRKRVLMQTYIFFQRWLVPYPNGKKKKVVGTCM